MDFGKVDLPLTVQSMDVSISAFNRPGQTKKIEVEEVSLTQYAWIEEANPDTTHNAAHPLELSATAFARKRALVKFDHSMHRGKVIIAATLEITNFTDQPKNAMRTLTAQRSFMDWTTDVTWNKYDNTNAWATPGGYDVTDQASATYQQTVSRPTIWDDTWQLDITAMYSGWCDGTLPNKGIILSCNGDLQIFSNSSKWPGYGMKIAVIYSHTSLTNGVVPDSEKISQSLVTLQLKRYSGLFSWQSGGSKNAMAIASELGWYSKYITNLRKFFDDKITTSGAFITNLSSYYMGPPFGEAWIHVHQKTGTVKYKIAIDAMKDYIIAHPRDDNGIIREDKKVESELIYCAMVFLACYADTYGDADHSIADLVLDQTIRLYDLLTSGQSDGIPYHMFSYYAAPINGYLGKGWARGMGWIFCGMGKLTRYSSVRNHSRFGELKSRYQALAAALAGLQKSNGMWRAAVHDKTKPDETSGTALIALGFECGVQTGVLDGQYIVNVNKAVDGMLKYTKTGIEMRQAFPVNQDLNYNITLYQANDFAFGFWCELLMNIYKR